MFYRFGEKTGHVAGVPCKVGDTNGAGDTFFGAALSKLCKEDLNTLTADKLEGILAFANKAASITTPRCHPRHAHPDRSGGLTHDAGIFLTICPP